MSIHIENIRRGMGLLVTRGPMKKRFAQYGGEMIGEEEDRSLHGVLLGVIAVSPPYVLCASFGAKTAKAEQVAQAEPQLMGLSLFFSPTFVEDSRQACMLLDTRRYQFAVASPEVIAAIVGKASNKWLNKDKSKEIGTPGSVKVDPSTGMVTLTVSEFADLPDGEGE